MRQLVALFFIAASSISIAAAANKCPDIPPSVGTGHRDFNADIRLNIGSFGKLKAGEVAIKAEVAAKNLFDKYPDANRRAVIEMMYASYCAMVDSSDIPAREKLDRLEAFSERLQRLIDATSTTAPSELGLRQQIQQGPSPQSRQEPSKKAYDLSQDRGYELLKILEIKQGEPRDTLRIGCVPWSEVACLAAGKFLILLSEAGWKIDSDQVYKVEPLIPVDGISITTRGDELANQETLPPHRGRWVKARPSEVVINMAFTQMGIPVRSSRDPSLPPDTLGVYFGPEPALTPTDPAKKVVRKQVMAFLSDGTEVEHICSRDSDEGCTSARRSWENQVSKYLRNKSFDSSTIREWKGARNSDGSPVEQVARQKTWLASLFYLLK